MDQRAADLGAAPAAVEEGHQAVAGVAGGGEPGEPAFALLEAAVGRLVGEEDHRLGRLAHRRQAVAGAVARLDAGRDAVQPGKPLGVGEVGDQGVWPEPPLDGAFAQRLSGDGEERRVGGRAGERQRRVGGAAERRLVPVPFERHPAGVPAVLDLNPARPVVEDLEVAVGVEAGDGAGPGARRGVGASPRSIETLAAAAARRWGRGEAAPLGEQPLAQLQGRGAGGGSSRRGARRRHRGRRRRGAQGDDEGARGRCGHRRRRSGRGRPARRRQTGTLQASASAGSRTKSGGIQRAASAASPGLGGGPGGPAGGDELGDQAGSASYARTAEDRRAWTATRAAGPRAGAGARGAHQDSRTPTATQRAAEPAGGSSSPNQGVGGAATVQRTACLTRLRIARTPKRTVHQVSACSSRSGTVGNAGRAGPGGKSS